MRAYVCACVCIRASVYVRSVVCAFAYKRKSFYALSVTCKRNPSVHGFGVGVVALPPVMTGSGHHIPADLTLGHSHAVVMASDSAYSVEDSCTPSSVLLQFGSEKVVVVPCILRMSVHTYVRLYVRACISFNVFLKSMFCLRQ